MTESRERAMIRALADALALRTSEQETNAWRLLVSARALLASPDTGMEWECKTKLCKHRNRGEPDYPIPGVHYCVKCGTIRPRVAAQARRKEQRP